MSSPSAKPKFAMWSSTNLARQLFELGLSLVVGLVVGALVILSWGLDPSWQGIILSLPIAFAVVMLIGDIEKSLLAAIAISVPLNLDVSLVISPYAHNPENIARGHRTLIALTELRLSLVLVLVLLGYALWIVESRVSNRRPVRFFPSMTLPALGLVFFSILSMTQAQDGQLALFRIVQLFELFLIYFYLVNHLGTIKDLQFFVTVSLGAALAESVLMIVQWITGLEFFVAGIEATVYGSGRVSGTLGSTGPAAGYISAQAIVACAMIWAFPKRSQKMLAVLTFILSTVALVSTGSRIGWLAFAVTVFFFVLVGMQIGQIKHQTLVPLVLVVLIIATLFYPMIYSRFARGERGSVEARSMMNKLAWKMVEAKPWLGVGAGNYALVTRDYYSPEVGDPDEVLDIQVHNRYLTILAESGIFAFLCYVAFFGVALLQSLSCIRSGRRRLSLMGLGVACALVSLGIQMLTGTFQVRPITLYSWFLPAMAAGLYYVKQNDPSPRADGGLQ